MRLYILIFVAVAFGTGIPRAATSGIPPAAKTAPSAPVEVAENLPNYVFIFIDDMGYGDVGCFGSEKNRTPNIDRMAENGVKFTDFYNASSVCTPSRAALLTGSYPRRNSTHLWPQWNKPEAEICVADVVSPMGMSPNEVTIADLLKQKGYSTACIGKWHLGDQPEFLPTRQGFDYYYGIPYSNNMGKKSIPLPLMRNEKVIEAPVNQDTITRRYTEESLKFIEANKDRPFFLYLPHTMVHWPLHAGEKFRGQSENGIYGDAVEEIDWSTGQILKKLEELGIEQNTLVIFTSDNGPRLDLGGSSGNLRGHKGQTWEGGMRVPFVAQYPGRIPSGLTVSEISGTIDILPTFAHLSGVKLPGDRIIDGKNVWDLMRGKPNAKTPHEALYYYQKQQLQCVRSGDWKLHLPMDPKLRNWGTAGAKSLKLYNLRDDIGEQRDVSGDHPEVVERLLKYAQRIRSDLGDMNQPGKNQRPAGWVETPRPQLLMPQANKHAAIEKPVTYQTPPSANYPDNFNDLTDGLTVGTSFQHPGWVGWQGQNAVFTVDLGERMRIEQLDVNCLRSLSVGIHLPQKVRYSVSDDGKNFREVAVVECPGEESRGKNATYRFEASQLSVRARSIRVEAESPARIPGGFNAAGKKGWLFIDEFLLNDETELENHFSS